MLPLVIGHRGAPSRYPENTLPSFAAALEQGCAGIELDVQQSTDGELWVFHDWSLERCTNGTGLLCEKTSAQLSRLDAGPDCDETRIPTRIPTLGQVLDLSAKREPRPKWIHIEVKELPGKRTTIETLAATIQRRSTAQQQSIVVSSFRHELLAQLHQIHPEIKIGLLLGHNPENLLQYVGNLSFPIYSLHPCIDFIEAGLVHFSKCRDIRLFPWTVNEKYQVQLCLQLGVDAVMSDYPDIFDSILE